MLRRKRRLRGTKALLQGKSGYWRLTQRPERSQELDKPELRPDI